MGKNTIIVIDDEAEFREVTVELSKQTLPDDWELIAPKTLDKAMEAVHERLVGIVFIDRNISGDGYQGLKEDGKEYQRVSGISIAAWLKDTLPKARRIAFSKGLLGCHQFGERVDEIFPYKPDLIDKGDKGEKGRKTFQEFLLRQIELVG